MAEIINLGRHTSAALLAVGLQTGTVHLRVTGHLTPCQEKRTQRNASANLSRDTFIRNHCDFDGYAELATRSLAGPEPKETISKCGLYD